MRDKRGRFSLRRCAAAHPGGLLRDFSAQGVDSRHDGALWCVAGVLHGVEPCGGISTVCLSTTCLKQQQQQNQRQLQPSHALTGMLHTQDSNTQRSHLRLAQAQQPADEVPLGILWAGHLLSATLVACVVASATARCATTTTAAAPVVPTSTAPPPLRIAPSSPILPSRLIFPTPVVPSVAHGTG